MSAHRIVATVCPSFHPIFLTYLTAATKLQALLDPTNSPSLSTRNLAMLTASGSDILSTHNQAQQMIVSVNHPPFSLYTPVPGGIGFGIQLGSE